MSKLEDKVRNGNLLNGSEHSGFLTEIIKRLNETEPNALPQNKKKFIKLYYFEPFSENSKIYTYVLVNTNRNESALFQINLNNHEFYYSIFDINSYSEPEISLVEQGIKEINVSSPLIKWAEEKYEQNRGYAVINHIYEVYFSPKFKKILNGKKKKEYHFLPVSNKYI